MLSNTEENYLKAVFKIAEREGTAVSTNAVAAAIKTTPASVTDMLKRLSEKQLLVYEKYRGVQLTAEGERLSTALIRKHRLWEVFLTEKLGYSWDEVHEIAEQLEHVQSDDLVSRLDEFLGYPKYDPHGDPIPDAEGRWTFRQQILLSALNEGQKGIVTGVDDHTPAFLQHLQQIGLILGARVQLVERVAYDQSLKIIVNDTPEMMISEKVSRHLFVKTTS
jgi:DtxR family transcriptional regulator, Mn-dependent transcriptional regulator